MPLPKIISGVQPNRLIFREGYSACDRRHYTMTEAQFKQDVRVNTLAVLNKSQGGVADDQPRRRLYYHVLDVAWVVDRLCAHGRECRAREPHWPGQLVVAGPTVAALAVVGDILDATEGPRHVRVQITTCQSFSWGFGSRTYPKGYGQIDPRCLTSELCLHRSRDLHRLPLPQRYAAVFYDRFYKPDSIFRASPPMTLAGAQLVAAQAEELADLVIQPGQSAHPPIDPASCAWPLAEITDIDRLMDLVRSSDDRSDLPPSFRHGCYS